MKKAFLIVVIAGMFVWALYDLAIDSDEAAKTDEQDFTVEEDAAEGGADGSASQADSDEVGLEIGNLAPDFELETMEGESIRLSDLRDEKVLVNFWASWCPPCRAEVPDLQKFYDNQDIEILAVNLTSTESSESDVDDFVDEYDMSFPVLLDEDTKVANRYDIQPIPSSFMIDSDGRIQFKALGAMNYELMVKEVEKMS